MKEMHTRREERKMGHREQASKINVEGEKIQNNKAGGHNCNKRNKVRRGAVESGGHAIFSHKRERTEAVRGCAIYQRKEGGYTTFVWFHIKEVGTGTVHFRSR